MHLREISKFLDDQYESVMRIKSMIIKIGNDNQTTGSIRMKDIVKSIDVWIE